MNILYGRRFNAEPLFLFFWIFMKQMVILLYFLIYLKKSCIEELHFLCNKQIYFSSDSHFNDKIFHDYDFIINNIIYIEIWTFVLF